MGNIYLIFLFGICCYVCDAGVTVSEIPSDSSEDETVIETVTEGPWIPSNVFDIRTNTKHVKTKTKHENTNFKESEIENDLSDLQPSWDTDSSPIFRAIRDFIFQTGEELLETEEKNDDPTEEIVKIIEKGLIEATTFLTSSDGQQLTTSDDQQLTTSEDPLSKQISIVKIENESPDSLLDRIGLNILDFSSNRQTSNVANTTTACSDCYTTLDTCVQMCFTKHNCHDVQRKARMCPSPSSRLCSIFTQWGPVDECKAHEDCTSPLLCCNDGCVNKCSPGVWRN